MLTGVEVPKKKTNYFCVYNHNEKKYVDVKYLNQHELAEGWEQVIPQNNQNKLINHFSVTLAYLPNKYWKKLYRQYKNGEVSYKVIKDGLTRYTIVETNQDDIMFSLYHEINRVVPNVSKLQYYISELDESQHNSWLVLSSKHYIKYGVVYTNHNITYEQLTVPTHNF
jgi:hypothetical protein